MVLVQISVDRKFSHRLGYYFLTGAYAQSDLHQLGQHRLSAERPLDLGYGMGITASRATQVVHSLLGMSLTSLGIRAHSWRFGLSTTEAVTA